MICFQAYIGDDTVSFLQENLAKQNSIQEVNVFLKKICGITNFFANNSDLDELKTKSLEYLSTLEDVNRREYGDFQTNNDLTKKVVQYLIKKEVHPEFILEPTCGKGNFILAVLKKFSSIKKLTGIEIYLPYVWETKFKILSFFLNNPSCNKPEIEIIHANAFNFPYDKLSKETIKFNTLIIGNPPWVTNSELGSINSQNLPNKSNFKKHKGFDAITGKGNFDIGEYITRLMFQAFDKHRGFFAFLIKSSVVKNILLNQKKDNYNISKIQKLNINTKKEFNVSVGACLFFSQFSKTPEYICQELDFYSKENRTILGWSKDKFVYSISDYANAKNIDEKSPFVWRQGVKHDCSKVMELEKSNGHYINKLKQEIDLESELLYGLLKSSDLKEKDVFKYRKTTIITQKKIGQDTSYIKQNFPKTFKYLNSNISFFEKRKSIIYKGKPPYSIFGIGDYSFAPYKIAISGMYKKTTFSLVHPENNKPIMLDDTCYFIGFSKLSHAQIAQYLLNSDLVQTLLKAIVFPDAKRSITKDILMRIDLVKVFQILFSKSSNIKSFNSEDLDSFEKMLSKGNKASNQMTLF